ncbi:MAG: hypothetical protein OEQ13_02935 [Acidobacteriota bacterium]|nr:hypothetical protein [Acidobacteriota bacterium]
MRKTTLLMTGFIAAIVIGTLPGLAAGPVDGEASLVYWMSDGAVFGDGGPELDEGTVGGRAEVWVFERWGARAGLYRAGFESGSDNIDYGNLDLLARVFSPTENNYVAVGLGWERIDLAPGVETSGVRVVAEGRMGLFGIVHGYGQAAYLPEMDDFFGASDVDGMEYDLGVAVEPGPFMTIRAGYRNTTLDFTDTLFVPGAGVESEAKGYHFGVGFHF